MLSFSKNHSKHQIDPESSSSGQRTRIAGHMLITFSGAVGSGKSTNARKVYHTLTELGYSVVYIRFRFLSWRHLFRPINHKVARAPGSSSPKAKSRPQSQKSHRNLRKHRLNRRLTTLKFGGYLWRMCLLRLFIALKMKNRIGICDRYFYDNFVYYRMSGPVERLYFKLLKQAMPEPDLALLFSASEKTIIDRRPGYDAGYLNRLLQRYNALKKEFHTLTVIQTDRIADIEPALNRILSQHLAMKEGSGRFRETIKCA